MMIYQLMDQIIYCESLEKGMRNLIELADILDKERYTSKLLDCFYDRIRISCMPLYDFGIDSFIEKSCYCILKGKSALSIYIALTIPRRKKPKQTLKELQNYANMQLTLFKDRAGNKVSEEIIEEVLKYLNDKYQFSEKVFKSKQMRVAFLILDMERKDYTSECITIQDREELYFAFFFYLINNEGKINRTAEEDIFYVLSVALIKQYTGNQNETPSEFIKLLKDSCIPNIERLDKDIQQSILTELLAMGLMYGSPFQEYDTHNYIHEDEKKLFNAVVEKMLNSME